MTLEIGKQKILRQSDSNADSYADSHADSHAPARIRNTGLRVTRRYRQSPQHVFDAWLDPDVAGQWLFATALRPMTRVEIDARVGGRFCFADRRNGERIEHSGEYIEIIPHRRLVFNLAAADDPRVATRVIVEISPRNKGCEISLSQEQALADDVNYTKERWTGILYGLGVALDSIAAAAFDRKTAAPGTRTARRRKNGSE